MNFQYICPKRPLKVLVVNALYDSSKLIILKIMLGVVFGSQQRVDLVLLVYENERNEAVALKRELESCSFNRTNTITVSTELPSITDAEVFCIVTNLRNPNRINFSVKESDTQFDSLYLLLKLAHNFSKYTPPPVEVEEDITKKKKHKLAVPPRKPIFMVDGLVALDILYTFAKVIPRDCIFCPTGITSVARTCLAEHLKVFCTDINNILVWASDDEVLHVEVDTPALLSDTIDKDIPLCHWKMMSKDVSERLKLDHTQFNVAWLKKDYIEKVVAVTSTNVYGPIYKASEYCSTLQAIWTGRESLDKPHLYNVGIVSDGSLGTLKGLPYVVPVVFQGDDYSVSKEFANTTYLLYVIQKLNRRVKDHHSKLIPHCKKFLQHHVINMAFVTSGDSVNDYNISDDDLPTKTAKSETSAYPSDNRSLNFSLSSSGYR